MIAVVNMLIGDYAINDKWSLNMKRQAAFMASPTAMKLPWKSAHRAAPGTTPSARRLNYISTSLMIHRHKVTWLPLHDTRVLLSTVKTSYTGPLVS